MTHDLLLSAEVAVGLVVLVVLLTIGYFLVRRRIIGRGNPLMLVYLKSSTRARTGFLAVAPDEVQWFPFLSLRLRPRYRWRRGDVTLGAPEPVTGQRFNTLAEPMAVDCTVGLATYRLVLTASDYTALRSWSESAPPGLNANVA